MALHVAEIYAAMVAQRRQILAALGEAPASKLAEDAGLDDRSILGALAHVASEEQRAVSHVLRRRPRLSDAEFQRDYLGGELTLESLECAWGRVAAEMREYIGREKPYELVFPRQDLGGLPGTPEQVLWGVIMHEMAHLGALVAACRRLGIDVPPLAPVDHLRRNPELGRWWMAEQY